MLTEPKPSQDRSWQPSDWKMPAPDIWRALLIEAFRREGGWIRQEDGRQPSTIADSKPFANISRWNDRHSDPAAVKLRYTKGARTVTVPSQLRWNDIGSLYAESGLSLRRVEALLTELLAESRATIDANPPRPVVGARPVDRSTVTATIASSANRAVPISAKSTKRTRGASSGTARRRKRSASGSSGSAGSAPEVGFQVPSNKFGSDGIVRSRSLRDHQPTPEQVKSRRREDRKKKRKTTTLGTSARGRSAAGKSRRQGLRTNGAVRVVRRGAAGTNRDSGSTSRVSAGAINDAVDTCAHEESHAAKGRYTRCPYCSHSIRENECSKCGATVDFKIETGVSSHHPLPCRAPVKRPLVK